MKKIKIFKQEIDDGVGDLVKSQASVAYCSPATLCKLLDPINDKVNEIVINKIIAENKNQQDLYYLESVLVSTGWNKNDDIFSAEAAWDARHTPEDKQFNYMHDENDIIGHITGCYVLDQNGQKVEPSEEEPPVSFDIITQAVLYNSWTQDENRERMEQIIAEIQEGKWFVSMECLFSGFDYGLTSPDGKFKKIERNEASAFLTKHLRSYGGSGQYEGYKIGRVLNNIAFSGKGLVRKPANSRSIILSSSAAELNTEDDNLISILKEGENKMSLEKDLEELKKELATSKEENEAIKAQIEEAKNKEFASKVESFEKAISDKDAAIATLEEQVKSTQARIAELEDSLATSQADLQVAVQSINEMKSKAKQEKRQATLIDAGVDQEDVESTLNSLASLEDEAFESVVAVMKKKAAWPPKKEDKEEEKKEEKKEVAEQVEATSETFEKVESTEATLIESTEVDELQKTKASIVSWLESNVLSK